MMDGFVCNVLAIHVAAREEAMHQNFMLRGCKWISAKETL